MATPIPTVESITPATLLQVTGITSVQHLLVQTAKTQHNMIPLMTSVRKAGDYQPTMNLEVLLVLATYPLFRLLLAGSTTMARSPILASASGGPLLRTIAAFSTACTTMVVAWVPATTTGTAGARCGVSALVS